MEERNRPAVALCDTGFLADARSAASSREIPGIRSLGVVGSAPVAEEIRARVTAAMDEIVAALTAPLTEEEKSPVKPAEKFPRKVFQGSLKDINKFFYKRGWSDGFPVIPPTEDEVAEMLTGTDLPPEHIIGKLVPRLGKVTVEKIAVNAVMAGALPTYMPVLIAGVQALLDPKMEYPVFGVSTGSWAPCWIINGPVRRDLRLNSSSGMLSPGDIANAAIGRALGLIIKNLGGVRKGVEDMGVMGNPMKYSTVIVENEEDSPWEPFHVERGLQKEDNAISGFFPNCYNQMIAYGADDKGVLGTIIYNLGPGRRDGQTCILLIPPYARTLAGKGWTKQDIREFIAANAHVPYYQHPNYWGSFVNERSRKRTPLNAQDPIQLIPYPDRIKIIVAGGPGGFMGIMRGSQFESGIRSSDFVTKKIELPAKWDKLVAKYKDMVPSYIRY